MRGLQHALVAACDLALALTGRVDDDSYPLLLIAALSCGAVSLVHLSGFRRLFRQDHEDWRDASRVRPAFRGSLGRSRGEESLNLGR